MAYTVSFFNVYLVIKKKIYSIKVFHDTLYRSNIKYTDFFISNTVKVNPPKKYNQTI